MNKRGLNYLLWIVVAVILLYGVVFPLFNLLWATAPVKFVEILAQAATVESIFSSVLVSVLSVVLSAVVGVPLAFLFGRYEFPLRRIFAALIALPLALPPLVGAVAFVFCWGESGIIGRSVQFLLGFDKPLWTLQGWTPVLLFHAYTMFPFFYLLTTAGLQRIDAGLQEAAQSLGANRFQTLTKIILPQLTPSLAAASLLVFMTSMSSFTAPYLFGGTVRVMTLEIFNARQGGQNEKAVVLTVILTLISLASLFFFQRFEGTRKFVAAATKGVSRRAEQIHSPFTKLLTFALGLLFSFVLLAPVATLIIISFSENYSWTTEVFPARYTTANYAGLFTGANSFEPFRNSFLMAGIAAAAALLWSFCIVQIMENGKRKMKNRQQANGEARFSIFNYQLSIINFLNLVPFALPGTALAVIVAQSYGQPTLLTGSFVLVGTFWILPFVYFLRFMPLVSRSLQASEEQFDPKLEEAAANLGANSFVRFWRVRLPLVLPGAIAGTLLALTIGLGEYVASILLFTTANRPISIEIAAQMRDFNLGTAAADGVILMLIIAACLLLANLLERRRG